MTNTNPNPNTEWAVAWDSDLNQHILVTPLQGVAQAPEEIRHPSTADSPAMEAIWERIQDVPIQNNVAVRSRQADLVNSAIFDNPIVVIGAGAIGSFTVLTLAKMGFKKLYVYDDDRVSVENISNQFYQYKHINALKVHALSNMIREFENLGIYIHAYKWTPQFNLFGYVVMAVDNMATRKLIYQSIKRNTDVYGFVDGRMGGQQAEVYSVNLIEAEHKRIYESYLWSDSEASELPCTQKAVMYNVLWIASTIANNLRLMMEEKPFHNAILMDFQNVNQINIKH